MIHQSSYGFALVFRPHDLWQEICIDRLGTTTQIFIVSDYLTLSWRRPLSNRNQSIDLPSKSMDRFLYDIGLHHERVNIDVREVRSFFKKNKSMWQGNFFPSRRRNWIHVFRKYFSNYVYPKGINKKLKEIGIIQFVAKLTIS